MILLIVAMFNKFRTKSDTDDKFKHYRLLKKPDTQQKYQKILKATGIN